jgi:hypothetical protein
MKRLIVLSSIFLIGCETQHSITDTKTLLAKIDSLQVEIKEQKEEINFLEDELQLRESEISYWGRKYDSLREVIDK